MKINDELKALCCSKIFPVGTDIEIYKKGESKNRVYILVGNGIHKVKLSSFRRVTNG